MKLKNYRFLLKNHYTYLYFAALALLIFVLLYRLGNLVSGVSPGEVAAAQAKYGWHGLSNSFFYFPLKLVRSIDFKLFAVHGQSLTRLPNALFGLLSALSFSFIIYVWHGKKISILSTFLFITAAWFLHASRLASYDILYLWGSISLLLTQCLLSEYSESKLATLLSFFIWGLLLTIPGFIYLLLVFFVLEKNLIIVAYFKNSTNTYKLLDILALIIWLPLTIKTLIHSANLKIYLGLPSHFPNIGHITKDFFAVAVHLFIRGPEYTNIWLGKAPILDFFVLALCVIGIYFYITHIKSSRAKLLFSLFTASYILIALGGAVTLSLIVPFAYIFAATGMAYLLHEWFSVFPKNPIARRLGISILCLAVFFSSLYNLRAYFVAWRHDPTTHQSFNRRLE